MLREHYKKPKNLNSLKKWGDAIILKKSYILHASLMLAVG
jgi:hypothetical protein